MNKVKLELTVAEVNYILNTLGTKCVYVEVVDLIKKVKDQAENQLAGANGATVGTG